MKTNQIDQLGHGQRLIKLLTGRRKTIILTGFAGSGKTTIITVLGTKGDVSDEDVMTETTGFIPYHIGFETSDGKKLYIRTDDSGGLPTVVEDEEFKKRLKKHHYILYLLNVNEFIKGGAHNEISLSWLKEIAKFARENNKPMMLVLTHADEYLKSVGKKYTEENKSEIRNKFLGYNGYLSKVKFFCETEVANVQSYEEVKRIIEKLIKL